MFPGRAIYEVRDTAWPGYGPWADTVRECRVYGELGRRAALGQAAAESPGDLPLLFKILPLVELFLTAWHPRTLGLAPPPPHDSALHRSIAGWRGANGA